MSRGKKHGGRDWVKGQSGNPAGRTKVPPEIKEARSLNKLEMERIMNKYAFMSLNDIREAINHSDTPAFEVTIASVILGAAMQGDHFRANFILDRMVGRPKEQIDLSSEGFKISVVDYTSE